MEFRMRTCILLIISSLIIHNVNSQLACSNYEDFFLNVNKYDPSFDLSAYVTPPLLVGTKEVLNLLTFSIVDRDYPESLNNYFTITTNDTNFYVLPSATNNKQFTFNFKQKEKIFYNVNNAHRYVVLMTVCDSGSPQRCGTAPVYVPLVNCNDNEPFSEPVVIAAAITLKPGSILGILNARDLDGDGVTFSLDNTNPPLVQSTITVQEDGVIKLKSPLTAFDKSFSFLVTIQDDGSSCDTSNSTRIFRQSKVSVKVILIEVNMHSPKFVQNSKGDNFCEKKYQIPENTKFEIEIVAQDDDERGDNGVLTILPPEISDRSPQAAFNITLQRQQGRKLAAIVSNLAEFDYEKPKYGSNVMNIMYIAEDRGVTKRRGYCFMTIEVLDVNDNRPVFSQNMYTIYIHDQYKTRQFNYRFVAIDLDSGLNGQVQYFMKYDPIASNLFNLALDGTLTIKNISYLDLCKESTLFYIYAEDMSTSRLRSVDVTVKIVKTTLKLLPPFFSDFPDPPEIRDVSEMTMRSSVLRNFSIVIQTNPTNQFLRCFLSPKPDPEWFKFEFTSLNQNIGKSETCYLKVEDPLNYRVASSMIVYMVAEIGHFQMPTTARELKILTVYLKEENISPPKFVTNTIEASVVEGDEDLGKTIAVVKAYDLDKTAPFNEVSYSFDANSNSEGFFSINPQTGEIKLEKRIQNKKNIPLGVIARDGANAYKQDQPNQNSIYVDIKVIDINDNPPVFSSSSYKFTVSEDSQPGFVIGRLEVTDEDTESFFNFSISDSTFGIRGIYDHTKIKSMLNYRGSAEIYLNNYLDFNKRSVYNLKVYVSDSQFTNSADLVIEVIDVNDRAPVFTGTPYTVTIDEMNVPTQPLIRLTATDDDRLPNDFLFECYSTPFLDKNWFKLDPKTGELSLLQGLDRDLSNGMPVYRLPVSVSDLGSSPNSLKTYTYVEIILNDINDNAPYVTYGSSNPLIIKENEPSGSVELFVVDVDTPKYGPPFTFTLLNYTDLFSLQQINCANCVDRARYQLVNKQPLNRNTQKYYVIPYSVVDNGGMARTGNLQLIVGDIDNNPQSDGSKQVKFLSLERNFQSNQFLGTLFVQDLDDWDLDRKVSSNCQSNPVNTFQVKSALQIFGPTSFTDFPKDTMNLQCSVTDPSASQVSAKVDFSTDNADYADTIDLAAIRLYGITAEDLMQKRQISDTSVLDNLQLKLIQILGIMPQTDTLKIVTVRNYLSSNAQSIKDQIPNFDTTYFGSDVYFFARKNGKILSSRLIYNLLTLNQNQLESDKYSGITYLFDSCASKSSDYCPSGSSCKQNLMLISPQSQTVDANATAFVGLNYLLNPECYCNLEITQPTCFNGGTMVTSAGGSDYYCTCPDGFDGPRCEMLNLQFTYSASSPSHSYALFDPIKLCDTIRVEFEFATDRAKGLLLFNGPVNRDASYFIAVEIVNKNLLVHIGYENVTFTEVDVSNKRWHRVDIIMSLDTVQVILDKCIAKTIVLNKFEQMSEDKLTTDDSKLSLGGIPPAISINHFYYSVLNVFEYEGCMRNLKVNGDLRNLKLSPVSGDYNSAMNTQQCDCKYLEECAKPITQPRVNSNEFPWWILLIILGALLMLATILGLALCTIRRKDNQKKMLQMFPDDDIRETIINYADGAGEENTENFNIGVIKKPVGPIVQPITTTTTTQMANMTEAKEHPEPSSNDQNMIYAYEGEGSEVGSLSSLGSTYSDKDQDYDYLKDWGPKFIKLSNMYVKNEETYIADYQNHGFDNNDDHYNKQFN